MYFCMSFVLVESNLCLVFNYQFISLLKPSELQTFLTTTKIIIKTNKL